MWEEEKFDKFFQGLKREVKLEVLETKSANFEDAAQIALRIDSALWSSSSSNFPFVSIGSNDPKEIGNIQSSNRVTE